MTNDVKAITEKLRSNTQRMSEVIEVAVKRGHAGTALVGAAAMEESLKKCLLAKMRPISGNLEARLFTGYGPIASFSARIDMAYALSILDEVTYTDLKTIKDIRNEFAHPKNLEYVSFLSDEVLRHVKRLSTYTGDDSNLSQMYLIRLRDIDKLIQPQNPGPTPPALEAASPDKET